MDDDDHQIGYQALPRGVPVHASDGAQIGTVHRVLDNAREHIFDGIVIDTDQGRRFVDAPEVARITAPPRHPDDRRRRGRRAPAADPRPAHRPAPLASLARRAVACAPMDAYLAVVSRREVRDYAARPLEPEVEHGILDAGRLAGSAKNRQPWTFLVVRDDDAVEAVAESVFEPGNIRGAAFVVAVHDGAAAPASTRAAPSRTCCWPPTRSGSAPAPTASATASASTAPCASTTTRRSPPCCRSATRRSPATRRGAAPSEWIERANRKPYDGRRAGEI